MSLLTYPSHQHWKPRVIIKPTMRSLAGSQVVIMYSCRHDACRFSVGEHLVGCVTWSKSIFGYWISGNEMWDINCRNSSTLAAVLHMQSYQHNYFLDNTLHLWIVTSGHSFQVLCLLKGTFIRWVKYMNVIIHSSLTKHVGFKQPNMIAIFCQMIGMIVSSKLKRPAFCGIFPPDFSLS